MKQELLVEVLMVADLNRDKAIEMVQRIKELIKKEIHLQRAEQALKQREGEATDAEALAYLYSASLAVPLRSEYVRIYSYLFQKTMRRLGIEPPPELCDVESLSEYEEGLLRELKEWLWEKSLKGFKEVVI